MAHKPTGPLAADLIAASKAARVTCVEHLIDEVDRAQREGEVDSFNPFRPWGEATQHAIVYAIQNTADEYVAAAMICDWLESVLED